MARFDVYRTPGRNDRAPYIADVQSDMTHGLLTRAVIPLIRRSDLVLTIRDLNPVVQVEGQPFILLTQELLTLPKSLLRRSVCSLSFHRDEITAALDVLFGTGR